MKVLGGWSPGAEQVAGPGPSLWESRCSSQLLGPEAPVQPPCLPRKTAHGGRRPRDLSEAISGRDQNLDFLPAAHTLLQ